MSRPKIAIVGGGVAGVTAAIELSRHGAKITLFEKKASLVSGPPFCHLHAGGNLYREIDDAACITLLRQSIDFAQHYPYAIDYRPTVISVPRSDPGDPKELLPRLKMLREQYRSMVENDPQKAVLGDWQDYFTIFDRQDLERLRPLCAPSSPQNAMEWMIKVSQQVDLDQLKFPLFLIREYGINLFRLSSGATHILRNDPNVTLHTDTIVTNVNDTNDRWHITYEKEGTSQSEPFDYLINAAGFKTGEIDEMLGLQVPRMVEFKAAYVTHWEQGSQSWPEVIFHGKRGTPRGMAQFTPYPDGYFQIHGMTKEITLFDEGLALSPSRYAQPRLNSRFIAKIEKGWPIDTALARTQAAIAYVARFIPSFASATPTSVPLFGAQQIPGTDISRRVAEVDFPLPRYARCEIVKVSSAPDMAAKIVKHFDLKGQIKKPSFNLTMSETSIDALASRLAKARGYPEALGRRLVVLPFKTA